MKEGHSTFSGSDGTQLFFRRSVPDRSRGVGIVVHGLTEHSGRYGYLRRALNDAGLAFYALDQRGHGLSRGSPGDVDGFGTLVEDLRLFCELVRKREPGLPLFVLGHSMGGLVAVKLAAAGPRWLGGVVLASTPVVPGPAIPKWGPLACRLLARITPRLRVDPGLSPELLTHDAEVLAALAADRLVLKTVTLRLAREVFEAARRLMDDARRITAPVLILQGSDDAVADGRGADLLARWIRSPDTETKRFTGLKHELFNESNEGRGPVLETVTCWLTRRIEEGGRS